MLCLDVLHHCRLGDERTDAVVTPVRTLVRVNPRVVQQVVLAGKGERAHVAPERLLPGMDTHVVTERLLADEAYAAHLAPVRFLARVAANHVVLQAALTRKVGRTEVAHKGTMAGVRGLVPAHAVPEGGRVLAQPAPEHAARRDFCGALGRQRTDPVARCPGREVQLD